MNCLYKHMIEKKKYVLNISYLTIYKLLQFLKEAKRGYAEMPLCKGYPGGEWPLVLKKNSLSRLLPDSFERS